jgi:hypothetical protein
MTTFGPDTGYVVSPDTGLIIASTSVVAHDMVSLAWLHENRLATLDHRTDKLVNDPHRSSFVRGTANRFVTSMLGGGISDILRTETPPEGTTGSIWNGRVLTSGFDAFGGIPKVELFDEKQSVPPALIQSLNTAVQPAL